MSSWASQQERSSRFWLQVLIFLYRLMGRRVGELALYPIAFFYSIAVPSVRRVSLQYSEILDLAEKRGPKSWLARQRFVYGHILAFAQCLLDKFAVWQGEIRREHIEFIGRDELHGRLVRGEGAVVIGAHLGNSEVLRAIAADLEGVRVNALMFTSHTPAFNEVLKETVGDSPMRMVPVEDLGPATIVMLRECIQRGEAVAILADRVTPGAPDKYISVDFLGVPAKFPVGPFVLASMLECPVFLSFCLRKRFDSYVVRIEHFSDRVVLPRATRAVAIKEIIQRFANRLGEVVREYPDQWFNFFPFWEGKSGEVSAEAIVKKVA